MLACYTYYNVLLQRMLNHQELGIDVINNAGSRFSGKSYASQEFLCKMANLKRKNGSYVKVGCYALRNEKSKVKELMLEIEQTLDRLEIAYTKNETKGFIKLTKSKNIIRVMGLYDRSNGIASNAGLARVENAEYIGIIYEEAYEFKSMDVQAFREAVRGNAKTQVLEMFICNPWSVKSPYIERLNRLFKFDETTLRLEGQQFAKKTFKTSNDIYFTEIFHYTNWRMAKDVLPKQKIKSIEDAYKVNPIRAKTADLGIPGYDNNSIYAYLLCNVATPVYKRHQRVGGGGDIGYGTSVRSGITSFVFGGITAGRDCDIYAEYTCDSKIDKLDINKQIQEILNFYELNYHQYIQKTGYRPMGQCEVYVDFSEMATIQMLNNECMRRYGRNSWLVFLPCKKLPINDRVNSVLYMMSKKKLRISVSCNNLLREMEIITWDDKKQVELKRKNEDDHGINAFEYFLSDTMYDMIDEKDRGAFGTIYNRRF